MYTTKEKKNNGQVIRFEIKRILWTILCIEIWVCFVYFFCYDILRYSSFRLLKEIATLISLEISMRLSVLLMLAYFSWIKFAWVCIFNHRNISSFQMSSSLNSIRIPTFELFRNLLHGQIEAMQRTTSNIKFTISISFS